MRNCSMKLNLIILTIIAGIGIASTAQAARLSDPAPSQWGCELSDEQLIQGITIGLSGRGWTITSNDGQGNLVAQVVVRGKHTLVVDIQYDSRTFDINYKDSVNLEYRVRRSGRVNIHRNANSWMENIQTDITATLVTLCNA